MTRFLLIFIIFWFASQLSIYAGGRRQEHVREILDSGWHHVQAGDYAGALDWYDRLHDCNVTTDNAADIAVGLMNGGNVSTMTGDYESAIKYYKEALHLANDTGQDEVYEKCLNNIACLYATFEHYRTALFYFEKSIARALRSGNHSLIAISAANASYANSRLGNIAEARRYIVMQKEYPLSGKDIQQYYLQFNEAAACIAEGKWNVAVRKFDDALKTAHRIPDGEFMALRCYGELGLAYQNLEMNDSAVACYGRVSDNNFVRDPYLLCRALGGIAQIHRNNGDTVTAALYLDKYNALSDSIVNTRRYDSLDADLRNFEDKTNELNIDRMDAKVSNRNRLIFIITLCLAFTVAILITVFIYHRKLKAAYILLVAKNDEIINAADQKRKEQLKQTEAHLDVDDVKAGDLYERIERVMENSDIICNPDFSISDLSSMVDSNSKYVSQVINTRCNKNFKTFLNEYRIREVCRQLADPETGDKFTLESMAESFGFKSPNTLWVVFKKIVGMTPAVYRRIQRESMK